MFKKVTIISTGSWSMALASVLSNNNHQILVYGKTMETVDEINYEHHNEKYANGYKLSKNIKATNCLKEALDYSKYIVIATPVKAVKEILENIDKITVDKKIYIIASKGLYNSNTISQLISEVLKDKVIATVALSGPSFSKWVLEEKITAVVSASTNIKYAKDVQKLFNNSYFRVYTSKDIEGVEYCGAIKNVIALGAGILEGKNSGANAKAALISRGLHEMVRFAKVMNIKKETLYGLTGVGDLVLTATDMTSRNYHLGYLIGKGYNLNDALKEVKTTAESLNTLNEMYQISISKNIEMPIINTIYNVIYLGKDIDEQLMILMDRKMKKEYL